MFTTRAKICDKNHIMNVVMEDKLELKIKEKSENAYVKY